MPRRNVPTVCVSHSPKPATRTPYTPGVPKRLPELERRRLLARELIELDFLHQDVHIRLEAALQNALDEVRRIQSEQVPDYILKSASAEPLDSEKVYELGFIAGFNRCAVTMSDALVYAFRRKRGAEKGLRNAVRRERRPTPNVLAVAREYQGRHPEASDREIARHVARKLNLRFEVARHLLRKKTGKT
jgi:hypothetical protein